MEENCLIKELTNFHAPTGKEKGIFDLIKKHTKGYVDEIYLHEKSNSIVLYKKGSSNFSLMLEAHVDEVFFVVTDIDKDGFIKFYSRSIDPKILPGSLVIVHGRKDLTGVIGIKPYHLVKEGEEHKAYSFDNLYIDLGLSADELKELVSIGDYITFKEDFSKLGNYYVNKSCDNRIGVYVVIEVLKRLKKIKHEFDIYGVLASQEEFTGLGAITSTFSIFPDLAIVFDVTFATQSGVSSNYGFDLGKGPAIFVGISGNKDKTKELIDIAERYGIPYQKEVGILSSTDLDKIELVRSGIPVILVSIPIRYMHTPIEMFDMSDVEKTVELVKLFIENYKAPVGDDHGEY